MRPGDAVTRRTKATMAAGTAAQVLRCRRKKHQGKDTAAGGTYSFPTGVVHAPSPRDETPCSCDVTCEVQKFGGYLRGLGVHSWSMLEAVHWGTNAALLRCVPPRVRCYEGIESLSPKWR